MVCHDRKTQALAGKVGESDLLRVEFSSAVEETQ